MVEPLSVRTVGLSMPVSAGEGDRQNARTNTYSRTNVLNLANTPLIYVTKKTEFEPSKDTL